MSVLIDELEARKNNYILIADVIERMMQATKSTANDVIRYLEAHKVNEHLARYQIDEYYNFHPIDEWLEELGENDAKVTYFERADLIKFEPITKHVSFTDSTIISITDVYGRTYDINQYKLNREDSYLTPSETIDYISCRTNASDDFKLSFDNKKLRDLARKKKITPCFYFNGYVGEINYQGVLNTEVIAGYFTYRLLTEEICGYEDYMKLPNEGVNIYRLLDKQTSEYVDFDNGVFLFSENPQGHTNIERVKLDYIDADEIRFSKQELDSYIDSLEPVSVTQDNKTVQESDKLIKELESLRAENDDLNARLCTARNTYKQQQNEIIALKTDNKQLEDDKSKLIEQLSNITDVSTEVEVVKGLDKVNIEKSIFIASAKAMADYIWSLDSKEAIRTGDMVQQIRLIMGNADYSLLPDEDKAIRKWLADIAPPYAKRPGRASKDDDKEITLTMKK